MTTFPKILLIFSCILFGFIGVLGYSKSKKNEEIPLIAVSEEVILVTPPSQLVEIEPEDKVEVVSSIIEDNPSTETAVEEDEVPLATVNDADLPKADRIAELFSKIEPNLKLVEVVTYRSRVNWLKGRPAWLSDYAAHYKTSRHFIARSLNQKKPEDKPDYNKQDVAEGDKFTVLRTDKIIEFYLLIDVSRCKMWFYALDRGAQTKTLLKDYTVGLGRPDTSKRSHSLTPLGIYRLGDKIAVYKPKGMGLHSGKKQEMIQIFGTRWIPFDKEVENCTASAKGFGIHGVPWTPNENGTYTQDEESLGKYESDGCVRLSTKEMEELFAIIVTKPTTVELVKDYRLATFTENFKSN